MQVLTKKSRKRAEKEPLKTARRISVEDLKIGMRIVTSWHKNLDLTPHIPKGLTDKQAAIWIAEATGYDYVAKSEAVKEIDECPGKWRTHIHVNKKDCYDMRQFVYVVN